MNSVARLHTILHNIANRLSSDDVKNLFAIVNCDLPVEDAYAFFLSMESAGEIDETNLTILKNLLRAINRQDLFVYLTLIPQVFNYRESSHGDIQHDKFNENSVSASRKRKQQKSLSATKKRARKDNSGTTRSADVDNDGCEIRVRVRAVYNDHSDALQTVQSMRQEPVERAFDKFSQTLGILQSRDLGSVVCETKFAELSYLDAFWKDYRNGTLLETLKGIFLKDSLTSSVRILVHIDEDEYLLARRQLIQASSSSAASSCSATS